MSARIKIKSFEALMFLSYFCLIIVGCQIFDNQRVSRTDVVRNYFEKETQIRELLEYFCSKIPNNREVSFGKGANNNRYLLSIGLPNWATDYKHPNVGGSNLKLDSHLMDSLLLALEWTHEAVDSLSQMLEKVNCSSISSGNPISIQYREGGFGQYSYLIYHDPISENDRLGVQGSLFDTLLQPNVVIRYVAPM